MESLRSIAACIGITGDFSVLRDFFGFLRARRAMSRCSPRSTA